MVVGLVGHNGPNVLSPVGAGGLRERGPVTTQFLNTSGEIALVTQELHRNATVRNVQMLVGLTLVSLMWSVPRILM